MERTPIYLVPLGYCGCGCGERTNIATRTDSRARHVKGRPMRFIRGHTARAYKPIGEGPNPGGRCLCGCGGLAPIAPHSKRAEGIVAGKPMRYIRGHSNRGNVGENWRVDEDGCFVWLGSISNRGYGEVKAYGTHQLAHRFFYEREHGELDAGLQLHHECDNRACVNPDHLEPLTPSAHKLRHTRGNDAD